EIKKVDKKDKEEKAKAACEKWIDVRSFGQVFAFKDTDSVSLGVRGPVTIHTAFSLNPVDIVSSQIIKSANGTTTEGDKKSTDTMGTKHRVKFGIYKVKGSINCQLAEKTGFTHEDAEKIKEALITLFENDASSARPEGSMSMEKLFWFEHNCKSGQYSSAKVHKSVYARPLTETPESIDDYDIGYDNSLDGLAPEIIE
ncbi:MAG: type I-C CRISPR-associated protein Cas7/Csd2, partial [Eubacterium sp.]